MIKKPFFSFGKPKLKYPVIQNHKNGAKEIALTEKATIILKQPYSLIYEDILKVGRRIKTGQRVSLNSGDNEYFISPVTGTIVEVSEYIGYLGLSQTLLSIKTEGEDQWDDEFKKAYKEISPETALKFLGSLPGCPDFDSLINSSLPLDAIFINGIDDDLLVTANQFILKSQREDLKKGIEYLRKITNVKQIIFIVTPDLAENAENLGAEVKAFEPVYPEALPEIIMKRVLKKTVPAGKSYRDLGSGFINAEAVAALAAAFDQGEAPVYKILTVINKDGSSVNVKARIGTPVKDILESLNIDTNDGDRLVLGGPMRGQSIYSENIPISDDTDAILVQDRGQVVLNADIPCINCGECVRACPAKIPVNMLVRLLENSLYEEAVQEYDLLSCIECGLCSYVCVAQIPVFHFIMLGKYEFGKQKRMEESNA